MKQRTAKTIPEVHPKLQIPIANCSTKFVWDFTEKGSSEEETLNLSEDIKIGTPGLLFGEWWLTLQFIPKMHVEMLN